ncbi:hypothetical protein CC86DRAFT_458759 [Ophiobolus disseminans]|uniref:Prolyl 4-hydroxylase alpha subunit Fe(2+) 2OG dioxygenase domain-containing protein n=1 Tax=Ophiobolus disseminans TaxID=1469910 RepID=A0A6A6ZMK6_9PLEO|nr:hypothetical protein CC86DRAFT_458759 [Ophiobolus disseminans]
MKARVNRKVMAGYRSFTDLPPIIISDDEDDAESLDVNVIGTVGLPLSLRDAQAIASIAKRSPFGKGVETVIDESVRKTWELDAAEFHCRNPAWNGYLDTLAKQALKGLGVELLSNVQPYKSLLYGPGAFFKVHRDMEKIPGMFGTLVVYLSSTLVVRCT